MINNIPEYILGIDIGGTNTVFGIVNTSGKIVYFNKLLTSKFKTAQDLIQEIHDILTNENAEYDFSAIGIGAPNGSSVSGCIENAPNLSWKGTIELQKITKEIFQLPVALTNDANAAGLGECAWGQCKGMNDIIMLTIGTGLGCCIISDGKLIIGHNGFAGEFGHITAVPDGRKCKCGKDGCLEQYVSASGILQTYYELSEEKIDDSRVVFDRIEYDKMALKTVQKTAQILGLHLANLINTTNPKAVCIAGGIANNGAILKPFLEPVIDKNILPMFKKDLKVFFSKLENQTSGVLGAAYLAFDLLIDAD